MWHRSEGRGYLYSGYSQELYNLNYAADFVGAHVDTMSFVVFKLGVLLTTLFLFFITTTLVSFTLRETQVDVGGSGWGEGRAIYVLSQ